jgi:hypothetical protein
MDFVIPTLSEAEGEESAVLATIPALEVQGLFHSQNRNPCDERP